MSGSVDQRSIGMCSASVMLKIWSDVTMSDAATFFAALAAITTIAYNVQKMYKESKNK